MGETAGDGDETRGAGGLRERKKALARTAIEDAALRLFLERGYERTSIDDIAEAVVMSKRTFFRYFAAKEDVLFAPEREEMQAVAAVLARRPPDESALDALRAAIDHMATHYEDQRARLLARYRLVTTTPALAAVYLALLAGFEGVIRAFVARRLGAGPEERRPRLLAAAAVTAFRVAAETWLEGDGRGHLPSLAKENLEILVGGMLR